MPKLVTRKNCCINNRSALSRKKNNKIFLTSKQLTHPSILFTFAVFTTMLSKSQWNLRNQNEIFHLKSPQIVSEIMLLQRRLIISCAVDKLFSSATKSCQKRAVKKKSSHVFIIVQRSAGSTSECKTEPFQNLVYNPY